MYINTKTLDYPVPFELLARLHPNTSFPEGVFTPPEPFAEVFTSDKPSFDPKLQYVIEDVPIFTNNIWTQTWKVQEIFATPEEREQSIQKAEEAENLNKREKAKRARAKAVEDIKVTTTTGRTFDGDETSQGRMSRALLAINTGAVTTVAWTLADNNVVQVTGPELAEALILAGQAQTNIWDTNLYME